MSELEDIVEDGINRLEEIFAFNGSVREAENEGYDGVDDESCTLLDQDILGLKGLRIFDVIVLISNLIFASFLLTGLRNARIKLRETPNSKTLRSFYIAVWIGTLVGFLFRCPYFGDVLLRFCLFTIEMSLVIYAMMGHYRVDVVKRLMMACIVVSTILAIADVGCGGRIAFRFAVSSICGIVYMGILIYSSIFEIEKRIKRSFYYYVGFLLILSLVQISGCVMIYGRVKSGYCVVEATILIYFTLFLPLVYFIFLAPFFTSSNSTQILFSYKAQVNEDEEEYRAQFSNLNSNDVEISRSNGNLTQHF